MRIQSMLAILTLNVVTLACAAQATDDSDSSGNAVKENKNKKETEGVGTLIPEKGSPTTAPTPAPKDVRDAAPESSTPSENLGPYCHALSLCCDGLRIDGYTSMAPDCDAIANHANENDCKGASANYAIGDDNYTVPVECIPP